MIRFVSCLAVLSIVLATPVFADADWSGWQDLEEIRVLTENPDGTVEETIIWIFVEGATAYIRTSESSGWGDNVDRQRTIEVRTGAEGETRTVTTTAITDEADRQRIIDGFRAKYGFYDAMINFIRGDARIWRIETPDA